MKREMLSPRYTRGSVTCSKSGDSAINISDCATTVRLKRGAEVAWPNTWRSSYRYFDMKVIHTALDIIRIRLIPLNASVCPNLGRVLIF
ncbi:hypothetical protein BF23_26665 [Klebsiella variicola]|nr:hypothetical protein BF23_26665 [Klebsiella variicola]